MRSLWVSGDQIPLMPESALPKVPGQRTREVASKTPSGTSARRILPCRFQRPPPPDPVDVAKQEASVLPPVPGYRFHTHGSSFGPKASRRRNWFSLYPAHLGTDLEPTSSLVFQQTARRTGKSHLSGPVSPIIQADRIPIGSALSGAAPAAHFKRLYRKGSGPTVLQHLGCNCRRPSDRDLPYLANVPVCGRSISRQMPRI